MISQEFLSAIAAEHGVSKAELEVLSLATSGQSTAAIAQQIGISGDAVRKRLSEVYHKFQIPGRGPVKLTKLQQILVNRYQAYLANQAANSTNGNVGDSPKTTSASPTQVDWGTAPDISSFYGRLNDLALLDQWIVGDQCRLIAILGIAGIGKTALSVKLAKQLQNRFEFTIWRSLRHAPPLQELLAEWLQRLPDPEDIAATDRIDLCISHLLDRLRHHRCLLVLDNVSAILQSEQLAGHYRSGYENYGQLFKRLGEEPHQSCLLLSSRKKPVEIACLEGATLPIRSLKLKGLTEGARQILKAKGLAGKNTWQYLIELYRGNPLALKMVSTTVNELFGGNVSEFLKYETLLVGDIASLLDQQFQRLADSEKDVLYALTISGKPVSLVTLRQALASPLSNSELMEVLKSLERRSLMEKASSPEKTSGEILFTLQPLVMKHIKENHLPAHLKPTPETIESTVASH